MGFLVFLIAIVLYIPLTIINMVFVFYKQKFRLKSINDYFYQTAVDIDRFGNRNMRTLWNAVLKKEGGYEFGDYRETISSALGKNKVKGTLSLTGLVLCKILHIFDKNHCTKSIKEW